MRTILSRTMLVGLALVALTTEARRYRVMAYTMTGNPNHPPTVPPGARWSRAAKQAEESASVAHELSAHHGRLATGRASQAPAGSERFEAAEGAPAPTEALLKELAATARTPATTAANRYAAQAQTYRAQVRKGSGDPAVHFDRETVSCPGR